MNNRNNSRLPELPPELDGIWEPIGRLIGILDKMAREAETMQRKIEWLERELQSYGDCEVCAFNACETLYEDCTGGCVECEHEECRCNGCMNFSKWKWRGEDE